LIDTGIAARGRNREPAEIVEMIRNRNGFQKRSCSSKERKRQSILCEGIALQADLRGSRRGKP